jgi:cobalamin biosynthesis protein CobD/CbiB
MGRFLVQVQRVASSPEGRRVFREARKLARDPQARRRIDAARRELTSAVRRPPAPGGR